MLRLDGDASPFVVVCQNITFFLYEASFTFKKTRAIPEGAKGIPTHLIAVYII
jgi:hypothetical protein